MSGYDLKSLNLPRLYGKALSLFAGAVSSPLIRPLLIGNLLENGGIPRLRKLKFDEEPTYYPLEIPPVHADGQLPVPQYDDTSTKQAGIPYHSFRDYAAAYRSGAVLPTGIAEKVLEAMAASDQNTIPLHAFVASDREDVRRQAEESQARIQAGQARSFLEGVPIAIKDEVDQVPYPSTVGTKFLGASPVKKDSFVAERLRAAGALLVGKTNMHEIGIYPNGSNVHHGRIANPYNLAHDSGGSSSGSAAAVAAGLVPGAIGADGGGSIRIPSSLCGVVGLKPTFGRVSERGAAPLCWSVAHLGPICATVEDAAILYSIIAGPDPEESLSWQQPPVRIDGWNIPDLKGLKIGVYPDWFKHASRDVVELNEKMVSEFEKAGADLVEISIPELDAMRVSHAVTILSEMAASMQNYAEHWGDFADSTKLSLILGKAMNSHDYLQAQRMRTRALKIFAHVYQQVDVILTPGTAIPAPLVPQQALANGWSDLGTDTELMRYAYPGNFTGLPAITFPVGYDQNGLPVSMQAMGRHWEEHLLLRVAYNAELRMKRQRAVTFYDILQAR